MKPEFLKEENERLVTERNALDVQVAALEEQLAEARAAIETLRLLRTADRHRIEYLESQVRALNGAIGR